MNPDNKEIFIEGQHNKYQMKRAQREKKKENKENKIEGVDFIHNEQVKSINQLFLNTSFPEKKIYENQIKKKINSYKSQDQKKKRYDEDTFISYEQVLNKLVVTKLKCDYCSNKINVISNRYRDEHQWTLERIDNNIGHTNENVIISCLECNLKRRTSNSDNFKFTKKLKIEKIV